MRGRKRGREGDGECVSEREGDREGERETRKEGVREGEGEKVGGRGEREGEIEKRDWEYRYELGIWKNSGVRREADKGEGMIGGRRDSEREGEKYEDRGKE